MALDLADYVASLEPSAADREQARGMAMWNAAAALIGGGPNRGRNIAQAMLGASQGYQTGLEQARRKRLADLHSLNMAQTMQEKEREIRQAADMRGLLNSAGTSIDQEARSVGPVQPYGGDVREKRRMLLERAAELAQAKGDQVSAARFLADADKLRDEWDVTPRKVMRDGKAVLIQTSKSGKERVMGYQPEPEKLHFGDTGGRAAVGFDPITGAPVTQGMPKTMTPGEIAANARSVESNAIAAGNRAAEMDRKGREDVDALRKEFSGLPQVKAFAESVPYINAARKAPDTPAGDFALIYGVGKILDPSSVVREGEMNLVIRSGSPAQRVEGFLRQLRGKGRLTPEMRAQLSEMLNQAVGERQGQYEAAKESFTEIAKSRGYDPAKVFVGQQEVVKPKETKNPKAPAIGVIEDGFVFMGGDPSNPKNWKKQ